MAEQHLDILKYNRLKSPLNVGPRCFGFTSSFPQPSVWALY